MQPAMKRGPKISPTKYYTVAQTISFLRGGGVGTSETVKKYCRKRRLTGKQIGAKRIWHVLGSSISALRKSFGLEDTQR
jgi:hypothetical protein